LKEVADISRYKRYENESDEELIYRVCSEKDKIGSWESVADILNELLGQEYTESKYRKQYQSFQKMFEYNRNRFSDSEDELNDIIDAKRELEKERQKLSDERVAYKKLIREKARNESIADQIRQILKEDTEPIRLNYKEPNVPESDCDLIVHLTDIHAGCGSDNYFNKFNDEVLKDRLEEFLDKIFEIQKRHHAQDCYLIIGEIVSGLIHNSLRIEQNENVINQFKIATSLICSFIDELSKRFGKVNVYITAGNHSRLMANLEDSIEGENFDYLFPFYAEAKLQNNKNVIFNENTFDESIAIFKVRDRLVMSAHGDKDSMNNVVNNFTQYYGVRPDMVYLGHLHTNGYLTTNDTKVIQSGTIAGTDSYAMGKRLRNKPEQTVSVITEKDGLDCIYDIKFQK
jgi:uncharacterized protein YejL (UPF0352 family)